MTLNQVKSSCRELHMGKRHQENFYLVRYERGWTIEAPEMFSTSNKAAIDFVLFTI